MRTWQTRSDPQRDPAGSGTCRCYARSQTSTVPQPAQSAYPRWLFWSGPNPQDVRWDVADPDRRRALYEIVLVQGTLDDIIELADGPALVAVWDRMYPPRHVRAA